MSLQVENLEHNMAKLTIEVAAEDVEMCIRDRKKGFTVEVLDYLEGDVAGIKGVTFEVRGENARCV